MHEKQAGGGTRAWKTARHGLEIAQSLQALSQNFTGTTGGPDVSLGDLATPAGVDLFAMDLTPLKSGIYLLTFVLRASMSADDEVEMVIQTAPALTSITGGATVGPGGSTHYETTGSPLVIASGARVEQSQWDTDTTFGGAGELQAVWAGVVQVPAGRSLCVVNLTGPVATYSGMKLNAFAKEQG